MKKYALPLLLIILTLSACHAEQEFQHKKSYHNAPRLKMPLGLTDNKMRDLYPVPPVAERNRDHQISLLPPGSQIAEYRRKK